MFLVVKLLLCVSFLTVGRSQGFFGYDTYPYLPYYYRNSWPQGNPLTAPGWDGDDWVYSDDRCQTPDSRLGDCVPVKRCLPMIEVLKTLRKPLSTSVVQQLNAYYCRSSYNSQLPHVCCPSGPITLQMNSDDGPQHPPDVSGHPNLHLLPTDCGYLQTDFDKIRNGEDTDLNEFPWMALLSYRTRRGPEFKCGGTVVNERYILTAAHCIQNLDTPLMGVRVGEYNIKTKVDCVSRKNGDRQCAPPVQDLAIEEIIPHPLFNSTIISNDIGLIRVSRMNINVENTRPVCLPLGKTKDNDFKHVIVTGWGITDTLTGASANILQKVKMPVVDLEQCKEVYKSQIRAKLTNKQVCAGGTKKKDSCPGDSGGPMHEAVVFNDQPHYVQQGVVSFGPRECGLEGYPGVYTRVAYYMDWILDTLKP